MIHKQMILNIFHVLDFDELNLYANYPPCLYLGLPCLSTGTLPLLLQHTPSHNCHPCYSANIRHALSAGSLL